MDRDLYGLLLVTGVVAVVVFLASPLSPLVRQVTAAEGLDVSWEPGKAVAHQARGGLFHPARCGQGRDGLIAWGWQWITDPPSEAQTGLGVG